MFKLTFRIVFASLILIPTISAYANTVADFVEVLGSKDCNMIHDYVKHADIPVLFNERKSMKTESTLKSSPTIWELYYRYSPEDAMILQQVKAQKAKFYSSGKRRELKIEKTENYGFFASMQILASQNRPDGHWVGVDRAYIKDGFIRIIEEGVYKSRSTMVAHDSSRISGSPAIIVNGLSTFHNCYVVGKVAMICSSSAMIPTNKYVETSSVDRYQTYIDFEFYDLYLQKESCK